MAATRSCSNAWTAPASPVRRSPGTRRSPPAGHKRSTHLFNTAPNGPALPGNEAFGIQWSFDGRFAVFVGGYPIVVDGEVVGGVGLCGGNGEQDTACGVAGAAGFARPAGAARHGQCWSQADIKK